MAITVRGGTVQRLQPAGTFDEHPAVRSAMVDLARRAQQGGASSIMFLPQRGVGFEAWAFGYHTGMAKEMNITRASGSVLRGTIVINISGHANGGVGDRVVGWAERELSRQGVRIGDDAKRFLALRALCTAALAELQRDLPRDPAHGKASVDVTFEGKTVALTRGLLDKISRANIDSGNAELFELAELGNGALRKLFACENSYNVRVRTADGKTSETRDIARNHAGKIEYSTRIPIELPLVAGETIIEAWPTGSAEVAGYVEARRYRVHYGKDLFDAAKAEATAQAYQAAHPEIRWGTAHEHADLESHHVGPSPHPYQDF